MFFISFFSAITKRTSIAISVDLSSCVRFHFRFWLCTRRLTHYICNTRKHKTASDSKIIHYLIQFSLNVIAIIPSYYLVHLNCFRVEAGFIFGETDDSRPNLSNIKPPSSSQAWGVRLLCWSTDWKGINAPVCGNLKCTNEILIKLCLIAL